MSIFLCAFLMASQLYPNARDLHAGIKQSQLVVLVPLP